eukprot:snap_masked-scaffold_27-processed-gene-4.12-mRNA-1 protein AED:1.00 eAED:1.00 QI:0/-1/0/0/-1/1/1/0/60
MVNFSYTFMRSKAFFKFVYNLNDLGGTHPSVDMSDGNPALIKATEELGGNHVRFITHFAT